MRYGLVPANLVPSNLASFFPFLTSMFVHSGWFHILSNMWVLFIFGDNVEDRLGKFRYVIFYLLGGLAAGALQTMVDPRSTLPAIGASGAIAAVLGAYFLFFPRARILTLILIIIIPWFVELPALVFLGFWFISQVFSGFLALSSSTGLLSGGIAWFAHIGGFIFGLVVGPLLALRGSQARHNLDDFLPPSSP